MLKSSGLRLGGPLALLIFVLDQFSKWLMVNHVLIPSQMIEVTPFFNLRLAWNTGAAFSIFAHRPELILIVSSVMVCLLGYWLVKADTRWAIIGLGLMIGGAVGNVVDRFIYGAVVDFLDVHAAGYHWPTFNLADSAICIGAGLLMLDALSQHRKSTN